MKGDYLHYKLLTLPASRWLPNPWLGTQGWGGLLAGRAGRGTLGGEWPQPPGFLAAPRMLGSVPYTARGLRSAGKSWLFAFAHWTTWGSLVDGVGVVGRKETNATRAAFDAYLNGLSLVVVSRDCYLMLTAFYLLGCSHISEGVVIVLPN